MIAWQPDCPDGAYGWNLSLHAFRTRGELEVDFIDRFHHTLWAIDAEATERVTDREAAPLLAAKSYVPTVRVW